MMQFPLGDGAIFAVVEPGNIQRLKEGRPLKVGNVMIAFTPDMQHFAELLGVNGDLPTKGERIEFEIRITPEQIDAALKACQDRTEFLR